MTKHEFMSPSWIEACYALLEELVSNAGAEIEEADFSICEVFTDAPAHLANLGDGRAAWTFRIKGRSVIVGREEVFDADYKVVADYHAVLPLVRIVHNNDPAIIAEMEAAAMKAARAGQVSVQGDKAKRPDALAPFHDRLAELTL